MPKENPFIPGSQNYMILEELKKGRSLFNFEIVKRFHCLAHTRRLKDIRDRGFPVKTDPVPGRKGVFISYLK